MEKKTETTIKTRAAQRQFEGEVVRVSGSKTIRVAVRTATMHPKYRKQYTRSRTYAVHDEKNDARAGDRVVFAECRPLSRSKRWVLRRIVARGVDQTEIV